MPSLKKKKIIVPSPSIVKKVSKENKQANNKKNRQSPKYTKKTLIVSHHKFKNPEKITILMHIRPTGRYLEKFILMMPLQTMAGQREGSKIQSFFPFYIAVSYYQQPAPNQLKLLNFHPERTHTKSSPWFAVIQRSHQLPRTNTSF